MKTEDALITKLKDMMDMFMHWSMNNIKNDSLRKLNFWVRKWSFTWLILKEVKNIYKILNSGQEYESYIKKEMLIKKIKIKIKNFFLGKLKN